MDISGLRIALFSGNYNMTLDGANKALNRLVEYLLRQGASVRVYSPTVEHPAFAPQGDLVSVPSFAIPGRSEYRIPVGLNREVREDLARFAPNILHISAPDFSARSAVRWAKAHGIPVLASVHTMFETYMAYYRLGFLERPMIAWIRELYQRCDALVAPTDSAIDTLREQGMHDDISLWSRGVDRTVFSSDKRDLAWRRSIGLQDDDVAVAFLGRLVLEKGLEVFSDTVKILRERGVQHEVLVIGDGPAREWFEKRLPGGHFVGFQTGPELGRSLASADVFFNPSTTEAIGNVTLEAMASGVPAVASDATGSRSLVIDGASGALVKPGDCHALADALQSYIEDGAKRAAHGAAGEARSKEFSWDPINQAMADTYLRLITAKRD